MPCLDLEAEILATRLHDVFRAEDEDLFLSRIDALPVWIGDQAEQDEVVVHSIFELLEVGRDEAPLLIVHVQERGVHGLVVGDSSPGRRRREATFVEGVLSVELPDECLVGWNECEIVNHWRERPLELLLVAQHWRGRADIATSSRALSEIDSVTKQIEAMVSSREREDLGLNLGEIVSALVIEVDVVDLLKAVEELRERAQVLQPHQLLQEGQLLVLSVGLFAHEVIADCPETVCDLPDVFRQVHLSPLSVHDLCNHPFWNGIKVLLKTLVILVIEAFWFPEDLAREDFALEIENLNARCIVPTHKILNRDSLQHVGEEAEEVPGETRVIECLIEAQGSG